MWIHLQKANMECCNKIFSVRRKIHFPYSWGRAGQQDQCFVSAAEGRLYQVGRGRPRERGGRHHGGAFITPRLSSPPNSSAAILLPHCQAAMLISSPLVTTASLALKPTTLASPRATATIIKLKQEQTSTETSIDTFSLKTSLIVMAVQLQNLDFLNYDTMKANRLS